MENGIHNDSVLAAYNAPPIPIDVEMASFDSLPPRIRAVVRDAPFKICCAHLLQAAFYFGEDYVIAAINDSMKHFLALAEQDLVHGLLLSEGRNG